MRCRACMDSSGPWCLCALCETCIDAGAQHKSPCHDVRPLRAELECARGTRITVAMPWDDSWSGPTPTSYRDVLSEVAHHVAAWAANKGCPCCGGCLTQRAPDCTGFECDVCECPF